MAKKTIIDERGGMPEERTAMNQTLSTVAPRIADAVRAIRHVFVRDLEIDALLGVYEHEKQATQKILVNVDLTVSESGPEHDDRLSGVVCYEEVVNSIKTIVASGHVNLVETMAEQMAAACLEDKRVLSVRIRVEKPDAFEDVRSVGVEIERTRPAASS